MKHLSEDAHNTWILDVKTALPVLHPLSTLQATTDFFLALNTAIMWANEKHFPKRKPPHARSQPWWDVDCTTAAQQLWAAGQGSVDE